MELICVARKPLSERNVAANVLRWGTGALNIDGCRVEGSGNYTFDREAGDRPRDQYRTGSTVKGSGRPTDLGRWPANCIHDGSDEVIAAFPAEAGAFAPVRGTEPSEHGATGIYGARERVGTVHHGDSGSAARFFYSAKADAVDRHGSGHPTVKPVDLMQWLCRLVTPPGGTVLDCFARSGTTGLAAKLEGFDCILMEREAEYVADIRRRLAWADGAGGLTAQERARPTKAKPPPMPLFGDDHD